MRRTGFTLIEVALVLTLLLALAALSFPALRSLTDSVMLDESVERVRSELLLARADAQREGTPIWVWAEPDAKSGWRISARRLSLSEGLSPEMASLDGGGLLSSASGNADGLNANGAGTGAEGAAGSAVSGASAEMADGMRRVARTLAVLPPGVRITRPGAAVEEPGWEAEFPLEGAGAEEGEVALLPLDAMDGGGEGDALVGPVTLGLFLPDGSAMSTVEFDVVAQVGGRAERVRVRVSEWTGRAEITEIPRPALDAEFTDEPAIGQTPGEAPRAGRDGGVDGGRGRTGNEGLDETAESGAGPAGGSQLGGPSGRTR